MWGIILHGDPANACAVPSEPAMASVLVVICALWIFSIVICAIDYSGDREFGIIEWKRKRSARMLWLAVIFGWVALPYFLYLIARLITHAAHDAIGGHK